MSVDERERAELFELLVATMGREATVRLVEALPPAGGRYATADQVAALERRMDARFDALRDEMLAAFRGELVQAVTVQTRQMIVGIAGAVVGVGGLALAFARFL